MDKKELIQQKKYHIITIGCQMNKSDSERIASFLELNNYKDTKDKYKADLVIINTCGIRQSAEDRIYGLVPSIKKNNPQSRIIITGCLSQRKDVQRRLKNKADTFLSIFELESFILENKIDNLKENSCEHLNIKPKYSSKISAFIPIGNGCNNFCSYCVVPYARGREKYRPAKDIIKEVEKLVKNNYKEITLIAQNVNSYKFEDINFANLLKTIDQIPGNFWLRFYTSHPKDMSDGLIKTIDNSSKICAHVHLPIQAGDDKILKAMNRKYTVEHYLKLIDKIKNIKFKNKKNTWQMPIAITTDIIVGFPGEGREEFNNTIELFKKVKFDLAYVSKYSPRVGTQAFKLKDDVSLEEKKSRDLELDKILRQIALENNQVYLEKTVTVLVESKKNQQEYYGKTETSKSVRFEANKENDLIGKFVNIKIKSIRDFGLRGELN